MNLEELRRDYKDDILRIAEKYGVTDIRVFGSVARGDATEDSDLDLMINTRKGFSVTNMLDFKDEVESIINSSLDITFEKAVRDYQW